jgi:Tol biopolymer transport system component
MQISRGRVRSSVGFDWLMGVLSTLLMCGVLIDGWAHSHGEVDQSFLTPWHALLYGSVAVNGLVLLVAGIRGLRQGYSFRNALPTGYWTAALGVVLFLIAGGFDGVWHQLFGIERGIVLLISVPHVILATAGAMVFSGPLRSVAAGYGRDQGGWRITGPAILATWALVTTVGFFLAYAQPIEDGFTALSVRPSTADVLYPMLYAAKPDGPVTRVFVPSKLDALAVDVSPDGKHLAYRVNRREDNATRPPSDIYVADADGRHGARVTNSGRHDTIPRWSPDGKWIAYVSIPAETSGDFEIVVMRPDGSQSKPLLRQTTSIDSLVWSPDGSSLAYGSRNGTVAMIAELDVKTGATRWLPFTANGDSPSWTTSGFAYATNDGAIHVSEVDGTRARVVVANSDGSPSLSRDGRTIAFLDSDMGSEQVFVANADGSNARDASQLSGLDVQGMSWAPDGRLLFSAMGRPGPLHTEAGRSLAMASIILEGVLVAGGTLLLVRRWRMPLGAITFLLTGFALAMAVESDFYLYAIAGLVTGLASDVAIAALRDRIRSGVAFRALGFAVPAAFTALYLAISVYAGGGTSWVWNLLLGAPVLAGIGGLLLAFCFDSPLDAPVPAI